MKTLLLIFLGLFVAQTSGAQSNKTETVAIKTHIYCDHCLQCSSCGTRIYKAIGKIEGVKFTKVNPDDNTVMVTYKTAVTNPEMIRKALSDAGFDADNLKANPEAYEKLDDCCKLK